MVRLRDVSSVDLLKRLHKVLPGARATRATVLIDENKINDAINTTEALLEDILEVVNEFAETDLVLDIKEALFDLGALNCYTGIAMIKMMEEVNAN